VGDVGIAGVVTTTGTGGGLLLRKKKNAAPAPPKTINATKAMTTGTMGPAPLLGPPPPIGAIRWGTPTTKLRLQYVQVTLVATPSQAHGAPHREQRTSLVVGVIMSP
jgi:hypothetical protein